MNIQPEQRITDSALNSPIHNQLVADMKKELLFKKNRRDEEDFLNAHKGLPFANALIHNDREKAIDDIYRKYISVELAHQIFTNALLTDLLNGLTIRKLSEFLKQPEFIN